MCTNRNKKRNVSDNKIITTLWAMDFIKYKRCSANIMYGHNDIVVSRGQKAENQSNEKIFYDFYGS